MPMLVTEMQDAYEADEDEEEIDDGEDGGADKDEDEQDDGDDADGQGGRERPGDEAERAGEDDEERDEAEDDEERADEPEHKLTDKPLSRASRTVVEAKQRAKEATAREEAARRELAEYKSREAERARQAADQTAVREAELLQQMTPEERMEYRFAKLEEQRQYDKRSADFRSWDEGDKSQYKAKAEGSTKLAATYKRHADQVEKLLALARQNGQNHSRELLLTLCVGKELLEMADKSPKGSAPKPTRKTPKSPNSRADVPSTPKGARKPTSEREVLYEKLKDVRL